MEVGEEEGKRRRGRGRTRRGKRTRITRGRRRTRIRRLRGTYFISSHPYLLIMALFFYDLFYAWLAREPSQLKPNPCLGGDVNGHMTTYRHDLVYHQANKHTQMFCKRIYVITVKFIL